MQVARVRTNKDTRTYIHISSRRVRFSSISCRSIHGRSKAFKHVYTPGASSPYNTGSLSHVYTPGRCRGRRRGQLRSIPRPTALLSPSAAVLLDNRVRPRQNVQHVKRLPLSSLANSPAVRAEHDRIRVPSTSLSVIPWSIRSFRCCPTKILWARNDRPQPVRVVD